ncbi:MAG: hypothetical protein K1X64_04340 [Myxococcaceae bacterium]|nr:hypothetical protein [Myxococcaceae bacterium]
MVRVTFSIALAAFVSMSDGELPVFSSSSSEDHGSHEGAHGHHPHHGSDHTLCHPHVHLPSATAVAPDIGLASLLTERFPRRAQVPPASPEPGDILHVPKAPLA